MLERICFDKMPMVVRAFIQTLFALPPPPAQVSAHQEPDCRHCGKSRLVLVMSAEQTHARGVDFKPCCCWKSLHEPHQLDHFRLHMLNFEAVPVTGLPCACPRLFVAPPLRALGGRERGKATAPYLLTGAISINAIFRENGVWAWGMENYIYALREGDREGGGIAQTKFIGDF